MRPSLISKIGPVALLVVVASMAAATNRQGARPSELPNVCKEAAPQAFVQWARQNALHLRGPSEFGPKEIRALKKLIGDARVVGMGEAARRVEEFYGFRHQLFRVLVEEFGFTALAMETGFVEALSLNDYVLGRIPEPEDWQRWFTFGYGDEVELQSLLRWMRAYNENPAHTRKVHFYGIDLMAPYISPLTALNAAFEYLSAVDNSFSGSTTENMLLALVKPFLGSGENLKGMDVSYRRYAQLSDAHRDSYTAHVADLLARFEANRLDYIARSSQDRFERARQAALVARQLDGAYRAARAARAPERPIFARAIWSLRDAAMMEHLLWAMDREGPSARIAIWAHNAHIAKGSVPSTRSDEDVVALWEQGPRLGTHLDAAFRNQYVAIGSTYYRGRGGRVAERPEAECGTIAAELASVNSAAFVLDMRKARSQRNAEWLSATRVLRADTPMSDWKVIPARAFDAMLFVRNASPVRLSAQLPRP